MDVMMATFMLPHIAAIASHLSSLGALMTLDAADATMKRVSTGALILAVGFAVSGPARAQLFKCSDASGKVTYQQKPCEGSASGKRIDATPANREVREAAAPLTAEPTPTPSPVPATAAPVDRWANHRPGYGLSRGMGTQHVVERWGWPTEIRNDRSYTFFHWCDMRIALLVDGRLEAWDAPFPDSKKGATLFNYGQPWTQATQRWGSDPNVMKVEPYSGPWQGRGEVRKWTALRWVVTDSAGNITSWCDAAQHRSPNIPPAFNPPWPSGKGG